MILMTITLKYLQYDFLDQTMPGMLPDPLLIGSILDLVGYPVSLTLIKNDFQDFELS
jgi:hypothetical protein